MENSQLGDEVRGILGGVIGQNLRDDSERFGEFIDGVLLLISDGFGVIINLVAEGDLASSTSWDEESGFESSLDDADRIVNRSFDLIAHHFVGSSDDDGGNSLDSLEENEIVVSDGFFVDLFTGSQIFRVEDLLTFWGGEGGDDGSLGGLGESSKIALIDSSESQDSSFNEVLLGDIVHTFGGNDDVGSGVDDLGASFSEDVEFLLSDLFEVLGVFDKDLDSHGHSELVEVEVKEGDLGSLDGGFHLLGGSHGLEGVSAENGALEGTLSVRFKDIDILDGVLFISDGSGRFTFKDGIDDDFSEQVTLGSNNFGAHRGLGSCNKSVLSEFSDIDGHLFGEEFAGLLGGHFVSLDDIGGVDFFFDEVVGSLEEFGGDDDDTGGSVTDFGVLKLGKFDENFGSWVFNFQLFQDCGTIIGDGDISQIIDEHFI